MQCLQLPRPGHRHPHAPLPCPAACPATHCCLQGDVCNSPMVLLTSVPQEDRQQPCQGALHSCNQSPLPGHSFIPSTSQFPCLSAQVCHHHHPLPHTGSGDQPHGQGCPGGWVRAAPFCHAMCIAAAHMLCPTVLSTAQPVVAARSQWEATTGLELHVAALVLWHEGRMLCQRVLHQDPQICTTRYKHFARHHATATELKAQDVCQPVGTHLCSICPVWCRGWALPYPPSTGLLARQPGETSEDFLEKLPISWLLQCLGNRKQIHGSALQAGIAEMLPWETEQRKGFRTQGKNGDLCLGLIFLPGQCPCQEGD